MTSRRLALLAVAALLAAGCAGDSPPPSADPDLARAALRGALEAWVKGEPTDALKSRSPAVVVVDHEWTVGVKLARFELGPDVPSGADLRCEATLWILDRRDKLVKRKAAYRVGTAPAVTVVREDE